MNSAAKGRKLYWIPRVLTIIFILFLSLFALDAFSGNASFLEKLIGFIIHLLPSFVLLAILATSWKYPVFSGIAFILISIAFTLFFDTYGHLYSFLAVSVPPFVIGALFIVFHVIPAKKTY